MTENEIVTQKDAQMQMFSQLMQGKLKNLERYCLAERFTSQARRFAASYG